MIYTTFMESAYVQSLPFLIDGLKITVMITVIGLFFGMIIGSLAGLGKLSKNKIIRGFWSVYVEVVRGTPILAQALFLYYGVSEDLIGLNISSFNAGVIAIAVNAGAYIAEIVRGAVYSIDKGQHEAGRSMGLTENQTMRYIIWPQAFKRMIPPLGNQFIISLKDTSVFSVIVVHDVVFMAKEYYNTTFEIFETLVMVCLLYLCITVPTALYLNRLERKLDV
ncbi:amino acid ABC transporter membrane protein, PAAT family [Virgibacillus subterraneus]|uniref:Amino acid ABC transporter membrane protein, PAAT family n=3 Tax=Virgibacillus TaxID=84406 RepID=A0A1H1F2E2_9BACI|nr:MULTISPECIES: amino acid ABC transporter permease [Virgibacillus]MBP1949962.1 glutamine transport system permease protein [Virgibacillus litoralis]SDQ94939.1 amino acid ABC transporter membrane protein, PAAT family [Virgibacillus salinus]SEQ96055.1 amino acid ABC transporter membrane protein, PAAT family [Virgibacillus subterraneus]